MFRFIVLLSIFAGAKFYVCLNVCKRQFWQLRTLFYSTRIHNLKKKNGFATVLFI